MQVVRLVDPGRVDRVIAFDSLPANILSGVKRGPCVGFTRAWQEWLGVKRGDTTATPFYVLDFRTVNRDKEKWQEITNYVRRSTDRNFRLMDNLIDMSAPLAADSYSAIDLEPENVPTIPLLKEEEPEAPKPEPLVEPKAIVDALVEEATSEPLTKRRGRPKRVEANA